MRTRAFAAVSVTVLMGGPTLAWAQSTEPPPVAAADSVERRIALERTVRERIGQIVRDSLGLTQDQFRQLRQTNRRFEEQRRPLLQEERGVRAELRQALQSGSQSDQAHVSTLMDQLYSVQQRRFNLNQEEQRDLSGFLSPVQRARYAAIQERVRLRLEEFRRQQRGAGGGVGQPPAGRLPRAAVPRPNVGRQSGKAPARRRP